MKTALLLICAAAITAAAVAEQLPATDDVNNSPSTDTASDDAVVPEKATDVVPEKHVVTAVPDKDVVTAVVPRLQVLHREEVHGWRARRVDGLERHADDVVLREQFVLERPLHAVRPARGDRALQVALQRTVRHAVVAPVL